MIFMSVETVLATERYIQLSADFSFKERTIKKNCLFMCKHSTHTHTDTYTDTHTHTHTDTHNEDTSDTRAPTLLAANGNGHGLGTTYM